jgi:glycosyltransferase involved in cell wall biosynthesis
MRVLHVDSGNLYGGVETLLRTLAKHRNMCPAMEPEFALCFEGRLSRELKLMGVRVHILGKTRASRPLTIHRARAELKRILGDSSFDVVICHGAWSQALLAPGVRSATSTQIFWLHDAAAGRHWLERWARRSVPDAVLCNSYYTSTTLPYLYPTVPHEVFYCPVESRLSTLTDQQRSEVRAAAETAQDATVIIQVSRMESWKGHESLLDALGFLSDCPDAVCWIVGGAQRAEEIAYLESLKSRAERLKITHKIRFMGERSDVPELLLAADIFCQPNSSPEPFGISFVEALFAGLPVVATSLGGAKEIIDASCGVLVTPNNPQELAALLRQLIKEPQLRNRLAKGGPPRATALCDTYTQMQRLHGLLVGFSNQVLSNEYITVTARA